MAPARPSIVSMMTCLDIRGGERPTLVEVFRTLPFVPEACWVYVEFEYSGPFAYRVLLEDMTEVAVYDSEPNLVLAGPSGRTAEVFQLSPKAYGILPGSYTVSIVQVENKRFLHERTVFFGEM
jgi:hypothetical protein